MRDAARASTPNANEPSPAIGGEGAGGSGSLVERLAARYEEEIASEVVMGSMPRSEVQRWLCAFAAELNEIAAGYRDASEVMQNAAWVVGSYLRNETRANATVATAPDDTTTTNASVEPSEPGAQP